MEQRYTALIKSAEAAFKNKKYASAKSLYKRAALIATDKSYPKEQIAMLDEELKQVKEQTVFNSTKDVKYNIIIARADNEFMGEDYVRSRVSYVLA